MAMGCGSCVMWPLRLIEELGIQGRNNEEVKPTAEIQDTMPPLGAHKWGVGMTGVVIPVTATNPIIASGSSP